jgi:hypothetical protein
MTDAKTGEVSHWGVRLSNCFVRAAVGQYAEAAPSPTANLRRRRWGLGCAGLGNVDSATERQLVAKEEAATVHGETGLQTRGEGGAAKVRR